MSHQSTSPVLARKRVAKADTFGEGGCACGAVRYHVTSAPLIVHACHCRLCQRQTGTSNAVNALIETDRIIVEFGEIETFLLDTPSGRGQRIARCNECKVALWSNYLINNQDDHLRFLRVGTLDEPERMPPDVHIHVASKQPWYVIPEGVHAVERFYHQETTWSQLSQQRLGKLIETTANRYK